MTRYDVIGLAEKGRRHSFNAVYDTGEELFRRTCDSRVGGVGVLVNTNVGKPALTIFVVYAPTSNYDEEEVEAFYMDFEKFYREDHTFFKIIIGDFNAKEDTVVDNIDEEYDRLFEHLHISAMKTEGSKFTKRGLPSETFELILQRGIAQAAGNRELTSELAK
uniref:Endo/exonuclease/phosphatase domain-containing protein n=1 Tax=Angiostrongylus cantonensis TaxID=6313 RepID=A0A0K0DKD6_ANGCA